MRAGFIGGAEYFALVPETSELDRLTQLDIPPRYGRGEEATDHVTLRSRSRHANGDASGSGGRS